ncbi:MAG: cryptochrome/photolyase family protein [Acidobacteriota bacterium]
MRHPTDSPFVPPRLDRAPERLVLVLGDQLDTRLLDPAHCPALAFDRERDAVLMVEARSEATHVPSHVQRTTVFLSAMRHHALTLVENGIAVDYVPLDEPDNTGALATEVVRRARIHAVDRLAVVRPGEWRVLDALDAAADDAGLRIDRVENPHFLSTPDEFAAWARGRRELILEYFYRHLRKRDGVLLDERGKPVGGQWNFDKENRRALPASVEPPEPLRFEPDAITREVVALVRRAFPDAPGRLDTFGWPVTRAEALAALDDFVRHRLPRFGAYQDAMRGGAPWLFHSLLSPPLNLGLLDPREVIDAAVRAHADGSAPIAAVEGFVRQILGWREFIRGVYWHEGRGYGDRNALDAHGKLPALYWTGRTDMACVADAVGQVLEHGYGHHIQRLMVTGNFALIAGVDPRAISDWYWAMYVDAIDWVTLPNTLGMGMHADGGVVGTKPYAATGKYIDRMSDHCKSCRFDPGVRHGDAACPFTTFYWDFLARHRDRFEGNRRMGFAYKNLDRLDELDAIRAHADTLRRRFGIVAEAAP